MKRWQDYKVIEYHRCDLDPAEGGCKPGSQKQCQHLKGILYHPGINCPYLSYPKESDVRVGG